MSVYYNEFDAKTAAWLRALIKQGLIADGEVDERSILEVQPDDVKGFKQCHFFAGIGGWSYALRLAGWPDNRFVWTGSPPCQPFSAAGQREGAADERHLWPKYFSLIRKCAPPVVFGEQVAAAISGGWLDAVFADMEGERYACAAAVLPACSVGAPHIRQRLWFVAESDDAKRRADMAGRNHGNGCSSRRQQGNGDASERGGTRKLADSNGRQSGNGRIQPSREHGFKQENASVDGCSVSGSGSGVMANAESIDGQIQLQPRRQGQPVSESRGSGGTGFMEHTSSQGLQARNGKDLRESRRREERRDTIGTGLHWADIEWLNCADGKARPTKPGLFPLAHGIPGRVASLRGAGNAIVPQVAAEVIGAYMDL